MVYKLIHTQTGKAFLITLGLSLFLFILRGIGFLSIWPGFVFLGGFALSLILGIVVTLQR
jgi:hypothetical protein